jgi:5'(3')-deoxyribonucleotidase
MKVLHLNHCIFCDMDGVLVDFVGGMCAAHECTSPYAFSTSLGVFDMEKLWGITAAKFWEPANHPGFWSSLGKTPEADEIVDLACSTVGTENVAILTAPNLSQYCVPEKREWIARYYPQLRNNILYGSAKRFLAGPGRVLLDDRDLNIENFRAAGGCGITVPRLWNKEHAEAAWVMSNLRVGLKEWEEKLG